MTYSYQKEKDLVSSVTHEVARSVAMGISQTPLGPLKDVYFITGSYYGHVMVGIGNNSNMAQANFREALPKDMADFIAEKAEINGVGLVPLTQEAFDIMKSQEKLKPQYQLGENIIVFAKEEAPKPA